MNDEIRKTAVRCYKWGANVTAIKSTGKHPYKNTAHRWKPYHTRRQTKEEAKGLGWDRKDLSGCGAVCGYAGWRCIDIDDCEEFWVVQKILDALGLPHSYRWVVKSGSGKGWHIWIRCQGALPPDFLQKKKGESGVRTGLPKKAEAFDHLEVRWERCQTLLPPSEHESGGQYEFFNGTPKKAPLEVSVECVVKAVHSVACAPEASAGENLSTAANAQQNGQATERAATEGLAMQAVGKAVDKARSTHERNRAGFWLACQLRDNGFSEEEALRFGRQYVETVAKDKPDDEYTFDEYESSVGQAFHSGAEREPWSRGKENKKDKTEAALRAALPIPESVYERLPSLLKRAVSFWEASHEKDVVLTGALPVVAGCMPNVKGPHADGWLAPNLFTCPVAPAGSGKGPMRYARRLGSDVDARLIEEGERRRKEWEARKNDPDREEPPGPEPPPLGFFLAGNSSAAALIDNLAANDGRGVIFETEIKTLATYLGQDWGDFRDVLLKGFHHEAITQDRKGRRLRIEGPRPSVALSGTPASVRELIPAVEDGLFSRFAFYYFSAPMQWRSHRPTERHLKREEFFDEAAKEMDDLHRALSEREEPLYVLLEDRHWDRLDATFASALEELEEQGARVLASCAKRAGVIAFRIAMILAVLHRFEDGANLKGARSIKATDEDVEAGISLAWTYLDHTLRLAGTLPDAEAATLSGKQLRFFRGLPEKFTTEEAEEAAKALGMSKRTGRRWLTKLTTSGQLEKVKHGCYRKKEPCPDVLSVLLEHSPSSEPAKKDKRTKRTRHKNGQPRHPASAFSGNGYSDSTMPHKNNGSSDVPALQKKQRVTTPKGPGTVVKVEGRTVYVELDSARIGEGEAFDLEDVEPLEAPF